MLHFFFENFNNKIISGWVGALPPNPKLLPKLLAMGEWVGLTKMDSFQFFVKNIFYFIFWGFSSGGFSFWKKSHQTITTQKLTHSLTHSKTHPTTSIRRINDQRRTFVHPLCSSLPRLHPSLTLACLKKMKEWNSPLQKMDRTKKRMWRLGHCTGDSSGHKSVSPISCVSFFLCGFPCTAELHCSCTDQ